jgi:hypothetical protein
MRKTWRQIRARVAVPVAALALAGCAAGAQHAMDHYGNIQPVDVQRPDDRYMVFDKPAEGRMMVTSSLGSAAAQGFGSGLTLGIVDTTPPLPHFQAAAETHLANTGRGHCRVTQGYLLIKPQFEFRYTCDPATTGLPPRAAGPVAATTTVTQAPAPRAAPFSPPPAR